MARKKTPWWPRLWFLALVALAVAYAWPTLHQPLGPEQASAFEIAKNWWQHNQLPYRDIPDTRMPGVHFMNLIAYIFFGAHDYAIRILELLALVAGGASIAKAAARRALTPVELGPVMFLFVCSYFIFVSPSAMGQSEIWAALCLIAAQSMLSIDKNRRRAAIVAGLWTGSAVVFRPEALCLVPLYFGQVMTLALMDRPEPEKAPTLIEITAAYWLGVIQPPAAFMGYFATRNGSAQLYASIFQRAPHTAFTDPHAGPLLVAAAMLLVVGFIAQRRRKLSVWLSLVAPAALLSIGVAVALQTSDWVIALPFVILCAADGLIALRQLWLPLPTLAALGLVAAFHYLK